MSTEVAVVMDNIIVEIFSVNSFMFGEEFIDEYILPRLRSYNPNIFELRLGKYYTLKGFAKEGKTIEIDYYPPYVEARLESKYRIWLWMFSDNTSYVKWTTTPKKIEIYA